MIIFRVIFKGRHVVFVCQGLFVRRCMLVILKALFSGDGCDGCIPGSLC